MNKGYGRWFLLIALSALSQSAFADSGKQALHVGKHEQQAHHRTLLTIPYQDREHLLHVMRNNLVNLGGLIDAMAEDDFKTVEKIADKMSLSEKKARGLARRGNSAFTAMGLQFHGLKAPAVKKAAAAKDRQATLHAMSEMVNTCIACHATFKVMEWPDNKVYREPEPVSLTLPEGVVIHVNQPTNAHDM